MKILFLALGNTDVASSRTRVFQYIPHLEKMGVKTRIVIHNNYLYRSNNHFLFNKFVSLNTHFKLFLFLVQAPFYNILYIQKLFLPVFYLNLLKLLNKKIIYDFDDAIYINDYNASLTGRILKRFNYSLSISSLVVIENSQTESYANKFNKNILKITGPIDCTRYFAINKEFKGPLIIGWIGSPSTTKYLDIVKNALIVVGKKYADKIQFITIGSKGFSLEGINYTNYEWNLNSEVTLLRKFDIGIMPLPDDEWSKGKGGYKILQYMAMGIPSVASPVGINTELIMNDINGYLASSEDDWIHYLQYLIEHPQIRRKFGDAAREIAEKNYSFEVYVPKLLDHIK